MFKYVKPTIERKNEYGSTGFIVIPFGCKSAFEYYQLIGRKLKENNKHQ